MDAAVLVGALVVLVREQGLARLLGPPPLERDARPRLGEFGGVRIHPLLARFGGGVDLLPGLKRAVEREHHPVLVVGQARHVPSVRLVVNTPDPHRPRPVPRRSMGFFGRGGNIVVIQILVRLCALGIFEIRKVVQDVFYGGRFYLLEFLLLLFRRRFRLQIS